MLATRSGNSHLAGVAGVFVHVKIFLVDEIGKVWQASSHLVLGGTLHFCNAFHFMIAKMQCVRFAASKLW